MESREVLSYIISQLQDKGVQKIQGTISRSEKKELNVEHGEISLFRTTFSHSIDLQAIKNNKEGTICINKIDKDSLDKTINNLVEIMNGSEIDDAYDIAELQNKETFSMGEENPSLDDMYDSIMSFNSYVKKKHPKIILEQAVLEHTFSKTHVKNTNGVNFTINKGLYNFFPMFTAKDGTDTSSFNYSFFSKQKLQSELKDEAYISELLAQSEEQTKTYPLKEKFVGKIIVTPHCITDFLGFIESMISDGALISGTSIYKDKLNKKIASNDLSIFSMPTDSRINAGYFITGEGYKAVNTPIIEKGFLKTHLLSRYGSKKTGGKHVLNSGGSYIVTPGDKSLAEMISEVDSGILLSRFSGGNPSDNGDFSGVAKNSYFIENGKIKHPIIETMVSGNIDKMINNISAISSNTIDFGTDVLPWICFDGITIS